VEAIEYARIYTDNYGRRYFVQPDRVGWYVVRYGIGGELRTIGGWTDGDRFAPYRPGATYESHAAALAALVAEVGSVQ